MSHQPIHRLPWDDRWSQPKLSQLLEPLKAHHRRAFENLMHQVAQLEAVEESILWYGPSWKWTIHFTLPAPAPAAPAASPRSSRGKLTPATPPAPRPTLCYLVPRVEAPLVCVPLSEPVIQGLPLQRLSKQIRDGINMAKCAVAIHWATWTPSNQAEVGHIMDLLKRVHKLSLTSEPAAKEA